MEIPTDDDNSATDNSNRSRASGRKHLRTRRIDPAPSTGPQGSSRGQNSRSARYLNSRNNNATHPGDVSGIEEYKEWNIVDNVRIKRKKRVRFSLDSWTEKELQHREIVSDFFSSGDRLAQEREVDDKDGPVKLASSFGLFEEVWKLPEVHQEISTYPLFGQPAYPPPQPGMYPPPQPGMYPPPPPGAEPPLPTLSELAMAPAPGTEPDGPPKLPPGPPPGPTLAERWAVFPVGWKIAIAVGLILIIGCVLVLLFVVFDITGGSFFKRSQP